MLGQLLTQSVIGTRELTEVISGGGARASARDVHCTDRSLVCCFSGQSVLQLAVVWVGVRYYCVGVLYYCVRVLYYCVRVLYYCVRVLYYCVRVLYCFNPQFFN